MAPRNFVTTTALFLSQNLITSSTILPFLTHTTPIFKPIGERSQIYRNAAWILEAFSLIFFSKHISGIFLLFVFGFNGPEPKFLYGFSRMPNRWNKKLQLHSVFCRKPSQFFACFWLWSFIASVFRAVLSSYFLIFRLLLTLCSNGTEQCRNCADTSECPNFFAGQL